MRLYLFDVDGTLLHSGGAGRRAIESAFRRVWDLRLSDEEFRNVRFHGRTDPVIFADVAAAAGLSLDEFRRREPEVVAAYLDLFPEEMRRSDGKRLYAGVRELVEVLAAEPRVALGLLTGNLEAGARAKLGAFDLNRFFPAGGFGSDSADRREVARFAWKRCQEHLGREIAADRVVVVGDTPSDVDCARAWGFGVVAVATGMHRVEDLRAWEPDLLFADFSDTAAVLAALAERFPLD
jgi:phosphoglycolate phosphatase